MALVLCLNELSCDVSAGEAEINHNMVRFVTMLREVRRRRSRSSLVTPEPLPHVNLADGYPISRWAADNRHRDSWRYLRSLQNQAPFTFSELPGSDDLGIEYAHQGRHAHGLGLAHRLDTLAVSIPAEPTWLAERVEVVRTTLSEASDPVLREERFDVRHASIADHADAHGPWLARAGLAEITTGRRLWAERFDFFPSLSFLPRVEGDLTRLDPRWLNPVRQRLAELQEAMASWDPHRNAFPTWGYVTLEHEQRRELCWFHDLDGAERRFDMHARFTPGPGRLYFRLVREETTARIAYIGRKLGL